MYARSTTFRAQSSPIDADIAHVRDTVMPALEGIEGYIGLSLLVDRPSRRCIATSSWQSEEAMRASAEAVRPVRDRVAELFGGSADVEEWEIAVLHRDHRSSDGACVRATWVKVGPGSARPSHRFLQDDYPARTRGARGILQCQFAGRPSVRSWRVLGDLRQRRSDGAEQRPVGQAQSHGQPGSSAEVLDVCDFELAIAHLRVPEMA